MTASTNMLTLREVAEELRISKSGAQRLVRGEIKDTPRLPSVMIGTRPMVRRTTLEAWQLEREKESLGVQSPA